MNHGFPPGSRRGGRFAPRASRCLPAVPVPGTEGLGDGAGSPSVPASSRGHPQARWQPCSPRLCLPSKPPHPPGMTLLCSLKMNAGGSGGFGAGSKPNRAALASCSGPLIEESVGRQRGCAGMLKKQQIGTRKPYVWSKTRGFPRGPGRGEGEAGLNKLILGVPKQAPTPQPGVTHLPPSVG